MPLKPLVSIITPSFNQAKFLRRTMESVLSQDYPNVEYILIDGGSTDGGLEIIREYADRLTFWESIPDQGHTDDIKKMEDKKPRQKLTLKFSGGVIKEWHCSFSSERFLIEQKEIFRQQIVGGTQK